MFLGKSPFGIKQMIEEVVQEDILCILILYSRQTDRLC